MDLELQQKLHLFVLQLVREQHSTRSILQALMEEANKLSAFKEYEGALEDARMAP
jgi:hypothetical protein